MRINHSFHLLTAIGTTYVLRRDTAPSRSEMTPALEDGIEGFCSLRISDTPRPRARRRHGPGARRRNGLSARRRNGLSARRATPRPSARGLSARRRHGQKNWASDDSSVLVGNSPQITEQEGRLVARLVF